MSTKNKIIRTDAENTLILRSTMDGKMLVGVDSAARVLIWTINAEEISGEIKLDFPSGLSYVYGLAISPDRRLIATVGEGPIKLWRLPEATLYRENASMDAIIQTVAFSPSGTRLLIADDYEALLVFSVETGTLELKGRAAERNSSLTFHPKDNIFAMTCSWQGGSRVRFFRLNNTLELLEGSDLKRTFDSLGPLSFNPEGTYYAFSDEYVHIYTYPGNHLCHSFDTNGTKLSYAIDGLITRRFWSEVVFIPNSHFVAAGSPDGMIFVWSIDNGQLIDVLHGHQGSIFSIALCTPSNVLASCGEDGTVRLWDIGDIVH